MNEYSIFRSQNVAFMRSLTDQKNDFANQLLICECYAVLQPTVLDVIRPVPSSTALPQNTIDDKKQ